MRVPSSGPQLGAEWLGHMWLYGYIFKTLLSCFQSDDTILHFLQQCVRVGVADILTDTWYDQSLILGRSSCISSGLA